MNTAKLGLYPVTIREARYGSYEGGQWVLITGTHEPEEDTEAFGEDPDCRSFWNERRLESPRVRTTKRDSLILAFSGGSPEDCLGQLSEYVQEEWPECGKCSEKKDWRRRWKVLCQPCEIKEHGVVRDGNE